MVFSHSVVGYDKLKNIIKKPTGVIILGRKKQMSKERKNLKKKKWIKNE